jgi:hypothetical protein
MNQHPTSAPGRLAVLVPIEDSAKGVGYKAMLLNGPCAGSCISHGATATHVIWFAAAAASDWLRETGFKEVPVSEAFHDRWSIYQERSAQIGDAMIRWVEDSGAAYVIDIQSGAHVRGRQLVQWLSASRQREINAVGVIDAAKGFWDRMEEEDLVKTQTEQDFMSFFRRPGAQMRMAT